MSSPGIKEDPSCSVTSAKKLREDELLHGPPPSPGPQGQCVPRRAGVGGLAQTSGGDWGGERGNRSDAPSEEVTLEPRLMVARLTCSPSEK